MNTSIKTAKRKGYAFILFKGEKAEIHNKKFLSFLHVSIKTKQKSEEETKNVSQTNS